MLKIVREVKPENKVVVMENMKPLQIGMVVSEGNYENCVVMRTASSTKFEVINLSKPGSNNCWLDNPDLLVRLLPKGEKITIELFNE